MNLIKVVEETGKSRDLLNIQQMANVAYASVYFDHLMHGIRRELTPLETRKHMMKVGTGEIDLNQYDIKVENGNVYVTAKESVGLNKN